MVADEERVEQLRYVLIPLHLCALQKGSWKTYDVGKVRTPTYPLRLGLIHTNPTLDGKVLEGEWVLAELRDKSTGERIYLESILNEETYWRQIPI